MGSGRVSNSNYTSAIRCVTLVNNPVMSWIGKWCNCDNRNLLVVIWDTFSVTFNQVIVATVKLFNVITSIYRLGNLGSVAVLLEYVSLSDYVRYCVSRSFLFSCFDLHFGLHDCWFCIGIVTFREWFFGVCFYDMVSLYILIYTLCTSMHCLASINLY